jgi:hypothetical protein
VVARAKGDQVAATYDVFISHNRADKPWAHALADRLSEISYNHRPLRPWLDEQVLDPGDAYESELTTALDRSRHLLVALSPESVASRWVKLEVDYFVERDPDCSRVTTVVLRPCEGIARLAKAARLEWAEHAATKVAFEIVRRLCPRPSPDLHRFRHVEDAFKRAVLHATSMSPTPERDRLRDALFAFDIDDPDLEGLAVQAFVRVGALLVQFQSNWPEYGYPAKLLLGDCLANALARSSAYRQVVRRYLESGSPTLLSVVARALSRVADLSPAHLDPTLLLGLVARLDSTELTREDDATIGLLCHALGKAREAPIVMMLIKLLGKAGPVARQVAAGSIGVSLLLKEVALITEDEPITDDRTRVAAPALLLSGELTTIARGQSPAVQHAVAIAHQELLHAYPDTPPAPWAMNWRFETAPAPALIERGPLLGIVARATVANMAAVAARIDARHAVCLAEARVVDALFDRAGALVIPAQSEDTHLCRRLRSRGVTFVMLSPHDIGALSDDDYLFADDSEVTVWRSAVRTRRLVDEFP